MMNLRCNKKLKKYQLEGSENSTHVIYDLDVDDEESFLADVENGVIDLKKVRYEKILFEDDEEGAEDSTQVFYEVNYDDCIDIDIEADDLDISILEEVLLQELDYSEEVENLYFYKPHFDKYVEKMLRNIYDKTEKKASFYRWRVLRGDVL